MFKNITEYSLPLAPKERANTLGHTLHLQQNKAKQPVPFSSTR